MLIEKRRILVPGDGITWIDRALAATSINEAPLTFDIVRESWTVGLPHTDPADRFIVATARALDLTLATADRRVIAQKPCRLLPSV